MPRSCRFLQCLSCNGTQLYCYPVYEVEVSVVVGLSVSDVIICNCGLLQTNLESETYFVLNVECLIECDLLTMTTILLPRLKTTELPKHV